ncbi:hypothetical protein KBY82_11810 [Cyanobium sp. AMD-g]|uniref:hypothetical protein n=1 Tax=Cyanobium sp. AMD-g TaxID=2823699 RepID=UPI0020CEB20E|nr:hypothetical protein [Cyanobium sp. AMD-g]MCP9931468.1 hypothetical protein [Cyanobium sp. AMD-g]
MILGRPHPTSAPSAVAHSPTNPVIGPDPFLSRLLAVVSIVLPVVFHGLPKCSPGVPSG